jgi:hypothetical protein
LIHPIQQGFESIKPVTPEDAIEVHPVDQWRKALRLDTILGLASLAPVAHQACEFQDAQMLGNYRLRDSGLIGQGSHGLFAVAAQALKYFPAGWVGQAGE